MNKFTMLDLIIDNVIFTWQCFRIPTTNPTILGSDFLDTYFVVLDTDDCTITLHCTRLLPASLVILYMISASQR